MGNVGSLHRSSGCSREVLQRQDGAGNVHVKRHCEALDWIKQWGCASLVWLNRLTAPVGARERWFICWVRGVITLEGWRVKLGSMVVAGVITAPWEKSTQHTPGHCTVVVSAEQGQKTRGARRRKLKVEEIWRRNVKLVVQLRVDFRGSLSWRRSEGDSCWHFRKVIWRRKLERDRKRVEWPLQGGESFHLRWKSSGLWVCCSWVMVVKKNNNNLVVVVGGWVDIVASVRSGEQSSELHSKLSVSLSVYISTLICGPEVGIMKKTDPGYKQLKWASFGVGGGGGGLSLTDRRRSSE